MIQTLKNIILLSLCASFCAAVSPSNTENSQNNEIESKNTNLQIPASSDKIATLSQNANLQNDKKIAKNAEFESIKTLEFPKDEAEEKQLNELFMAIESLDSDKIQKLVKQNPRLVNLQKDKPGVNSLVKAVAVYGTSKQTQNKKALQNIKILLDNNANPNNNCAYSDDFKSTLLPLFILTPMKTDKKIEVINFLVKYGKLDLYKPCFIDENNEMAYIPVILFTSMNFNDEKIELFKFLTKKKINIKNLSAKRKSRN